MVVVVVMVIGVDEPAADSIAAAMGAGIEMVVFGLTLRFFVTAVVFSSSDDEDEEEDEELEDDEEEEEVEGDRALRFWPAMGVEATGAAGLVIFAT